MHSGFKFRKKTTTLTRRGVYDYNFLTFSVLLFLLNSPDIYIPVTIHITTIFAITMKVKTFLLDTINASNAKDIFFIT
jgi:hypothetical protein